MALRSSKYSWDIALLTACPLSSKKRVFGYTYTEISLFSFTAHRKISKQLCIRHFRSLFLGSGPFAFTSASANSLSKGDLTSDSSLEKGRIDHSSKAKKITTPEKRRPTRKTLFVCNLILKVQKFFEASSPSKGVIKTTHFATHFWHSTFQKAVSCIRGGKILLSSIIRRKSIAVVKIPLVVRNTQHQNFNRKW